MEVRRPTRSDEALVLVTGATGFVGAALLRSLALRGRWRLAAASRRQAILPDAVEGRCSPQLAAESDWSAVVQGVDVVVHTAARVHVMDDPAANPLAAFRAVNAAGTVTLARQAARSGVRRFVFLSSVKVNGEGTAPGRPFSELDTPAPLDPYGISKLEAEQQLFAVGVETGMEIVIIRPPLVYGPGVKANFLSMLRWLERGVPIPLGAVQHNRRSLLSLDNLVDLIATCLDHPDAANQVFLAGDGEDLATADLLHRLAAALGVRDRVMSVPVWMLEAGASLFGRRAWIQRLCGSLQVDISKARDRLGWTPPVSVDEGLLKTARAYLALRNR